jgi:small subunit ribosomal protein S18
MCTFCADKVERIDYKDVARLRRYLSDRAKIEPRRKTGSCAKHQRMVTTALKRARHMALLPYTAEQVRAMMSPQARALAGGPPPPRPERPPYRSDYAPRPPAPRETAERPVERPERPERTEPSRT